MSINPIHMPKLNYNSTKGKIVVSESNNKILPIDIIRYINEYLFFSTLDDTNISRVVYYYFNSKTQ